MIRAAAEEIKKIDVFKIRFEDMYLYLKHKIHRFTHYEYWSYWLFYTPVLIYYIYKSIRHLSLMVPTATNPMIEHSGALLENKKEIDKNIPETLKPKTVYFKINTTYEIVENSFDKNFKGFPVIAKPDIGERGDYVRIIRSESELKDYVATAARDYHLQDYIDGGFEAGVFVVKRPGQEVQITSITTKGLFQVTGDGRRTLLELLKQNPRYYFLQESIQKIYPDYPWQTILNKNENFIIEPVANHCRGTAFLNGNHLKTMQLNEFFHNLMNKLPHFYYGRFDLKSTSEADFQMGKNIKIFELNGLFGEPGHIYDPSTTLLQAWTSLLKHWSWAYEIALNNNANGHKYSRFSDIISMLRSYFTQDDSLK